MIITEAIKVTAFLLNEAASVAFEAALFGIEAPVRVAAGRMLAPVCGVEETPSLRPSRDLPFGA